MNRSFFPHILGLVLMLHATGLYAQKTTGPVDKHEVPSSIPSLDFQGNRAMIPSGIDADNVVWQRDAYRMLDLNLDENAPLYFPPQPLGDRRNLFSILFEGIANDEIAVYDYLDGKEIFNDDHKVKFEEMLNRFWIPFEKKADPKNPKKTVYQIETVDIPSNEVTLYYVKESYYLDQATSTLKTKVIAFCPVLVREDETGEVRKYPLFWVPFDGVRDLLSQNSLSINNNAASRMNIADFFNRRLYKGELYKVYNLRNQNIMEYCRTPEEVAAEQERLERELAEAGNSLWVIPQKEALEAERDQQKTDRKSRKNEE